MRLNNILLLPFITFIFTACSNITSEPPVRTLSPGETRGQAVFKANCATCHSISSDVVVGPSLNGIATNASDRIPGMDARTYISSIILNPDIYNVDGYVDNLMPRNFKDLISEEDFEALVAYLLTLE